MEDVLIMILMSVGMGGLWLCKWRFSTVAYRGGLLINIQGSTGTAIFCSATQGAGNQGF